MSDPFDTHSATWQITPDLLSIVDTDGAFTEVNPAWHTVLGRAPDEMRGLPFLDFLHPDDVDRTLAAFAWAKAGTPVLQFHNRYRHADGSFRWLSWNAVPEGGRYFCTARDVTEFKKMAADLQARTLEGTLREEFIAVLGHDLRNPLAAVTSALRIVKRDPTAARVPEVIGMAENAVDRMSALIDDVMDFARARLGGDIGIRRSPKVDLRPVVAQTVEEVRVAHPNATFVEEYRHADPVNCDPDRIGQLVSNLLGNATTHGDPSHPVRIETLDEGPIFILNVSNFGETISRDRQDELFEPFTRGVQATPQQGLGLGLYISRSIAESHGGTMGVESGNGLTTFTLRMPRV